MNAIEFETNIKDGVIKIPDEFQIKSKEHIKVIVMYHDNKTEKHSENMIQSLLKNPVKKNSFTPLKRDEIYE